MKLVFKEDVIIGKYYLEYCLEHSLKTMYLGTYNGQYMKGIWRLRKCKTLLSKGRFVSSLDKIVYTDTGSWPLSSIQGSLYELNDDEVLQYVVMEQL